MVLWPYCSTMPGDDFRWHVTQASLLVASASMVPGRVGSGLRPIERTTTASASTTRVTTRPATSARARPMQLAVTHRGAGFQPGERPGTLVGSAPGGDGGETRARFVELVHAVLIEAPYPVRRVDL